MMLFAYDPTSTSESGAVAIVFVVLFVGFMVAYWLWTCYSVEDIQRPKPRSIVPFDVCHALLEGLEKTIIQDVKITSKDWFWSFRVRNYGRFIEVNFHCNGMVELRIWLPARYEKGRVLYEEPIIAFNDSSKLAGFVRYYVSIVKSADNYSRESLGERKPVAGLDDPSYVHLFNSRIAANHEQKIQRKT